MALHRALSQIIERWQTLMGPVWNLTPAPVRCHYFNGRYTSVIISSSRTFGPTLT